MEQVISEYTKPLVKELIKEVNTEIRTVCEYIEENFNENITLDCLSKAANLKTILYSVPLPGIWELHLINI